METDSEPPAALACILGSGYVSSEAPPHLFCLSLNLRMVGHIFVKVLGVRKLFKVPDPHRDFV